MIRILATCRNLDLLRSSTLVFDTIRVGFPDEPIHVEANTQFPEATKAISEAAFKVGATFGYTYTIHHEWIERLIETETKPFFVCDTDITFFKKFDYSPLLGTALAGTYTPQFMDPFSRCRTMERLHTCLMYINPNVLRKRMAAWDMTCPTSPFTPKANLIYPLVVPTLNGNTFFDTCSMLYQAVGGYAFHDQQLDSFAHLHCGTWADLIEKAMPGMLSLHKDASENHEIAKNLRKMQSQFYAKHAC
jgi:hypothetical protein